MVLVRSDSEVVRNGPLLVKFLTDGLQPEAWASVGVAGATAKPATTTAAAIEARRNLLGEMVIVGCSPLGVQRICWSLPGQQVLSAEPFLLDIDFRVN